MTDAYVFAGSLLCPDCARAVLIDLVVERREPHAAPEDVRSGCRTMKTPELCELAHRQRGLAVGLATDTDRVPEGPHDDGGGEADTPQHCDRCGLFLANPLTPEGERGLAIMMADAVANGRIPEPLALWAAHYGLKFDNAPRAAMADDPQRFEQFLILAGACSRGLAWAKGKSLREAWATCDDVGYMEWLLETFGVDSSDMRELTEPEDYRGAFPDVVTLEPDPTFDPWRATGDEHYGLPVFEQNGERFAWARTEGHARRAAEESMLESLWAFRSDFLRDFIPALANGRARAAFDRMREALCEDANELVRAMLGDRLQDMMDAAIDADGLGHILATYDGEQQDMRGGLGFRID